MKQIYSVGWKCYPSRGPTKKTKKTEKGLSGTKNDV